MWSVVALLLAAVCAAPISAGGEWTSWRGDGHHGVAPDTELVSDWSVDGKNLIWHQPFVGRSTPVVVDGRACVIGRVGDGSTRQEIVTCFDAEDGTKLWEHRHNVYNTTVPFNRVGWASLVADAATGNIFAHGVAGQLIAFDPQGNIVWSRFLAEEFGRLSGYGGRTQTPIIDGDQLILTSVFSGWGEHSPPRHRFFSFDKHTGDVLWISTPGGMPKDMNTQSVPVIAEIDGQRLVIGGSADGWIYALKAGTGEKVWGFQLSRRGINSTVLVAGNTVFASHSEENVDDSVMGRLVAIDARGKGDITKTNELWRINEMTAGFPSPAYQEGILYPVDNSANLYAIEADSGEVRWSFPLGTVGKASPVLADGKLFVTETNGRVHIIEPGDREAKSLSHQEIELHDEDRYAEIYASPAIAYNRIYVATEGGVYCIGDKTKPIQVPSRRADKKRKLRRVKGEPAAIQVVPAEFMLAPGETIKLEARGFDASGELMGKLKPTWSVQGLAGEIDRSGTFRAAGATQFSAGKVTATVGGVNGTARGRTMTSGSWSEGFDGFDVGEVPPHWIAAKGKYVIQEKDGSKVLTKLYRKRGLLRNALYMGPSSMSNYTVEAELMGGKVKRRSSDIGLINGGYTMDLLGNHQRIQVRSWASEERMAQEVDFPWEMGVWYHMKLRVDTSPEQAVIRGKVWKKGTPEPGAWTIVVEDDLPIQNGSPGLIGYSPVDIYFDNVKVTVN